MKFEIAIVVCLLTFLSMYSNVNGDEPSKNEEVTEKLGVRVELEGLLIDPSSVKQVENLYWVKIVKTNRSDIKAGELIPLGNSMYKKLLSLQRIDKLPLDLKEGDLVKVVGFFTGSYVGLPKDIDKVMKPNNKSLSSLYGEPREFQFIESFEMLSIKKIKGEPTNKP